MKTFKDKIRDIFGDSLKDGLITTHGDAQKAEREQEEIIDNIISLILEDVVGEDERVRTMAEELVLRKGQMDPLPYGKNELRQEQRLILKKII